MLPRLSHSGQSRASAPRYADVAADAAITPSAAIAAMMPCRMPLPSLTLLLPPPFHYASASLLYFDFARIFRYYLPPLPLMLARC